MISGKEFLKKVKRVIRRIPGIEVIFRIKLQIMRIRSSSKLVRENRIVVFHMYSGMESDDTFARAMVQEVVREWLDLYGVIHIRRATAVTIGAPPGADLLCAPQAFLRIPSSHDEYLKLIPHDARKNIRHAERDGYEFKEFIWNDHLDEIFEINTSKEVRQSEPMRGWYREPVKPRHSCKEELLCKKYYGAFKDGKLYAYLHYLIYGDFAIFKHAIGHAQHLSFGIMNGLISYTVRECIKNPQLRWLHYAEYNEESLGVFKKRAGFQGYAMLLDLENDRDLLKYSTRKVRMLWPV